MLSIRLSGMEEYDEHSLVLMSIGSVYIAFLLVHVFGGPLTEQEIDHYLKLFKQRGIVEEQAAMLEQFMFRHW